LRYGSVSKFQNRRGGSVNSTRGFSHGFSIQDQNGAPLLSTTYLTAAKTEWARETIEIVLADAVENVIPD
jgi:hypothetical protein